MTIPNIIYPCSTHRRLTEKFIKNQRLIYLKRLLTLTPCAYLCISFGFFIFNILFERKFYDYFYYQLCR